MKFFRFLTLEIIGNQLGLPINSHVKELLFWEKQAIGLGSFSNNFQKKVDLKKQKSIFPEEMNHFIRTLTDRLSATPEVLDVGCGPVSLLSYAHHQGDIKLTGVDILANSYRTLLTSYDYSDCINGINLVDSTAEDMNRYFENNSFDIVFCCNALDHTDSPARSLERMSDATRKGGFVVIAGNVKEGTNESWDGIHMHDLFIENEALFREGKNGKRTKLDTDLPLKVVFSKTVEAVPVNKMFIVYEKQ